MMLFKKISQIMASMKKGINLVMMNFITIFRSIIRKRIKDFMMFFTLRWRVLLLMLSEHLQEVLILINWVIISRFLDLILWLTPISTYGSSKSIAIPVSNFLVLSSPLSYPKWYKILWSKLYIMKIDFGLHVSTTS